MAHNLPLPEPAAQKQKVDAILTRAKGRGHMDHSDVAELMQGAATDADAEQSLVDYFATPAGQVEMAKAGKGGADPRELARDVMRGR